MTSRYASRRVQSNEVVLLKEDWEQVRSTVNAILQSLSGLEEIKLVGGAATAGHKCVLPKVRVDAMKQWLEDLRTITVQE